jgi:hypothetical protein
MGSSEQRRQLIRPDGFALPVTRPRQIVGRANLLESRTPAKKGFLSRIKQ